MQVSVIVPVYNAQQFVEQAVSSALAQPETAEVVLVEDGSTDGSLRICQTLVAKDSRVKLLRHPRGRNRGAGASRNLGILNATCEYIAFLDADDFFLPGRFDTAKRVLAADPSLDGVYEAMGMHFYDEASRARWELLRGKNQLTTMSRRVTPEELFEAQGPIGPYGYCTTGGWVVKRTVFEATGLFDVHLRQCEDTMMYIKFAAAGRMAPGRLHAPVVMRGVHSANRSSAVRPPLAEYRDRVRMWAAIWRWGKQNLSSARRELVLDRFLDYALRPHRECASQWASLMLSRLQITAVMFAFPDLLMETTFRLRYRWTVVPYWLRASVMSIIRWVTSYGAVKDDLEQSVVTGTRGSDSTISSSEAH